MQPSVTFADEKNLTSVKKNKLLSYYISLFSYKYLFRMFNLKLI